MHIGYHLVAQLSVSPDGYMYHNIIRKVKALGLKRALSSLMSICISTPVVARNVLGLDRSYVALVDIYVH